MTFLALRHCHRWDELGSGGYGMAWSAIRAFAQASQDEARTAAKRAAKLEAKQLKLLRSVGSSKSQPDAKPKGDAKKAAEAPKHPKSVELTEVATPAEVAAPAPATESTEQSAPAAASPASLVGAGAEDLD